MIGKQIVNIVSAYDPHVGLSAKEKNDLWDSFIIVLSGIPKQDDLPINNTNSNGERLSPCLTQILHNYLF